jgi:hypothetical protein
MANEYVSKEQFGEFGKRREQAFAHVHQRLDEQHQNFLRSTGIYAKRVAGCSSSTCWWFLAW